MARGWRLSSVTFLCCLKTIPHIIILSSRHESDIPSLPGRQVSMFHHPSLGASTPNRGKNRIFLPPELSLLLKRRSVNKFRHRYSMLWPLSVVPKNTNGRLAIPALAGLLIDIVLYLHLSCCILHLQLHVFCFFFSLLCVYMSCNNQGWHARKYQW